MAQNFLLPERDQLYLLPPSLADWLPEDHLCFFVLDAVEEMDLSSFSASYREDGRGGAAHHPPTMVALLLYAYCQGVRSSREIERACHVDVACRIICAGLFPDHSTIARFRQHHEEALKGLFTAPLRLCHRAGMASVGLVALDGTKMAAPAAMAANRTAEAIGAEVEKMFADAEAADAAEDVLFEEARGDEPPAVLRGRAERRRRFKAAKELLDAELAEERETHEAHLAERAVKESDQGSKLRVYSVVGQRARESQLEAETAITATVETIDNDRSFDLLGKDGRDSREWEPALLDGYTPPKHPR